MTKVYAAMRRAGPTSHPRTPVYIRNMI